jgi:flagellar hook-length control protein FliK
VAEPGKSRSDLTRPVQSISTAVNAAASQTLVRLHETRTAEPAGTTATDASVTAVHLRALPASASAPGQANPQPAPQVPVNALAVHIAQQANKGARRFDIRLDPPELGRLDVRIDVTRDGQVTTHLVVERAETLDLLQRDARSLERALQNAGLDTSEGGLKFSLGGQGAERQEAGDDGAAKSGAPAQNGAGADDTAEDNPDAVLDGGHYLARDGLDIRI